MTFALSVQSRDHQGLALRRLGSAGSAPPRRARDAYGGHHQDRRRRDDALSHVPRAHLRYAILGTYVGGRLLAPTTRPADGVPLAWHRRVRATQFARRTTT